MGLVDAIWADVLSIGRLLGVCFGENGFSGCMCQLVDILQPMWRAVSTNRIARCEIGDPFQMIIVHIFDEVIKGAEAVVNDYVVPLINDLIPFADVPDACFPTGLNPLRCWRTRDNLESVNCDGAVQGTEDMCYYERVMHICSSDDQLRDYHDLFISGYKSLNETQAEFARAFGESYEMINPAAATLFAQLEASHGDGPDLGQRRDICSSYAFANAMSLDMVRWQTLTAPH